MKTIKRDTGFHIYTTEDVLYLELTDCDFAVFKERGKSGVTVKLTEDMATRLGLIGCMAKWRT